MFENGRINLPSSVSLHVTRQGGHLGYIGVTGVDPDRRWLDWRVVDYVLAQAGTRQDGRADRLTTTQRGPRQNGRGAAEDVQRQETAAG
jgi:hypothetical protein